MGNVNEQQQAEQLIDINTGSKMKIYNNVSTSQLSIAKYYGGMKIQGEEYKYDYANDALVRTVDLKKYCVEIAKFKRAKQPRWKS